MERTLTCHQLRHAVIIHARIATLDAAAALLTYGVAEFLANQNRFYETGWWRRHCGRESCS